MIAAIIALACALFSTLYTYRRERWDVRLFLAFGWAWFGIAVGFAIWGQS